MRKVVEVFSLSVCAGLLAACDTTGPGPAVTIRFSAAGMTIASPAASAGIVGSAAAPQNLVITGSNGTLEISEIRIIVDEVELERDDVASCDVDPEPEGCEGFEGGPFFVEVPLTGSPVTVASADIPAGSYTELEFEVDDGELDDDETGPQVQELLSAIRAAFPDWPEQASMVVVGAFTPTGGAARPFRVYVRAEIEVELEFDTPLVIEESNKSVTVELNPEMWFKRSNGTVMDLSAFDFPGTQQVLELELEIEHGFRIEIED